jgi:hypothetical protein
MLGNSLKVMNKDDNQKEGESMKRILLGVIILAFFIASCSSVEQKKWERSWEGPVISPSPKESTH